MSDDDTTAADILGCECCGTDEEVTGANAREEQPTDERSEEGSTHEDGPVSRKDGRDQGGGTNESGVWRPKSSILTAELPEELQVGLGRLLGRERVRSIDAWIDDITERTGVAPISIDDLCLVEERTEHWGTKDGERYYFRCFYDAVILAAMTDESVDIRTKSPEGTIVGASAVGSEQLSVSPPDAVFSFGVERGIDLHGSDRPTHQDIYEAHCPYVKAFPDRDSYEQWAETVSASTIATTLDGATEIAAKITDSESE